MLSSVILLVRNLEKYVPFPSGLELAMVSMFSLKEPMVVSTISTGAFVVVSKVSTDSIVELVVVSTKELAMLSTVKIGLIKLNNQTD